MTSRKLRLAVLATHPIQYQSPWFRALAKQEGLSLMVFFVFLPEDQQQGVGFGIPFKWDVPLTEGFPSTVLGNVAREPTLGRFLGGRVRGLAAALDGFSPDALLVTGWNSLALVQGLAVGVVRRIPIIARGESNSIRRRGVVKRLLHAGLMSCLDAVLVIGKSNAEFYREAGVEESRLFACPYFVDNEFFRSRAAALRSARGRLRAEWRIRTDAVCFLFAGKLVAKKRPVDFLLGLEHAHRNGSRVHGLVVGTGSEMSDLRRVVEARQLPVTFAGFLNQSEIPRAYVAADCLVLPSDDGETWGLVVNEAMSCGLPAIVSDRVGCGQDLVESGRTGFVFPLGDVEALGSLMTRLAGDRRLLEALGLGARERVARYSVEAAVDGTLAALRSVAA